MELVLRRSTTASVAAALVSTLALAAFGATPARAQRAMTPGDVARLSWVSDAVVSPDGTRVAYGLDVQRVPFEDEDGRAWTTLHVVDADGTSRPFVTGAVNVSGIGWTPDGRAISFRAERGDDEETGLYLIPVGGGEARRVLEHPTGVTAYSWSGDGAAVAYLATAEEDEAKAELEESGFDAVVFEEEELPDELWIARRQDDGTYGETRRIELGGHGVDLAWCPGGDRLAVAVAPVALVDAEYMQSRLRILDPATGETVASIANPGKLGEMAWSPDCGRLAFLGGETVHDPAAGRLMVADAANGSFRDIVPGYPGQVEDLAWADRESLVFLGDEGVETVIYRIGRDGSARRVLRPAGSPVWGDLTLSSDGTTLALVGETAHHPEEVFLGTITADGARPRRLTDSNPWLAEIRFGRQEVVTWEARDGVSLQGVLIHPLDRAPGERVPLVLAVHGGPESHDRNGWLTSYSDPGQVGAGRGWAIFYPNYRGSTGRGVEFSMVSQGRPAMEEFDDLVDAVDHFIEAGLADRERVGITGGSYGGYASAWGATRYSERFAAAVMFVGISNKISKIGESDIPEELYLVHERKRLWEDWQHFLEASPIYHVEKARTPILILHGDSDTRVHPSQSLELYRAIKAATDTPTRLVYYPGEGHGNRRAASRYDYQLRMLRWFEHYLDGPGGEPPPAAIDYPLRDAAE